MAKTITVTIEERCTLAYDIEVPDGYTEEQAYWAFTSLAERIDTKVGSRVREDLQYADVHWKTSYDDFWDTDTLGEDETAELMDQMKANR